ncbi:wall-associated receptor kinase-like protein 1 [Cinnamomum micranthum f. kanehirae]|uniref:Wall-associated receptor kinase-like protein 1 n=1 Tax=Cinnamomum micranthum f. kanehirae TaxID=337451 RepID=A0A3S3Q6X1_9MAGN|nr:wall-associated receptor kinase-like protein 1 [Cinnamomum micranthum f. kanehirae]
MAETEVTISSFECLHSLVPLETPAEPLQVLLHARLIHISSSAAMADDSGFEILGALNCSATRACTLHRTEIGYLGIYQDRPIYIKIYHLREEAFNEIVVLAQLKRTNVVKLMGCCFEMERPISILEYVPYSLSNHLFVANPSSSSPISWEHRLRIAIEIAYAITYLHIGTSSPIVHRDIKCSNILLDEHFKPKLSDFSLSVTIPVGETQVETRIAGTHGYIDPAYICTGFVCEKTDVYSYGVNGIPFWIFRSGILSTEITDKEKELKLILGNGLYMNVNQVEQAMACMELAGRCITHNRDERPSMKDVTKQLWQIERAELPTPPFSSS